MNSLITISLSLNVMFNVYKKVILNLNYIIVYFWVAYLSLETAFLLGVFFSRSFMENAIYISDNNLWKSNRVSIWKNSKFNTSGS